MTLNVLLTEKSLRNTGLEKRCLQLNPLALDSKLKNYSRQNIPFHLKIITNESLRICVQHKYLEAGMNDNSLNLNIFSLNFYEIL
jgi:hypothetical protein